MSSIDSCKHCLDGFYVFCYCVIRNHRHLSPEDADYLMPHCRGTSSVISIIEAGRGWRLGI